MTTTAKSKAKTKPAVHDLSHGPVAAVFNASVIPLFAAAVGKATGLIPPWAPLAGTAALAAVFVVVGVYRRPRRLSTVSIVYRAAVSLAAGSWLWAQLATFTPVGLSTTQMITLAVSWPAAVTLAVAMLLARRLPTLVRLVVPAVPLTVAAAITVTHWDAVVRWAHDALVVVDRFGGGMAAFDWLGYAVLSVLMVAGPAGVLGAAFASRERSADEELAEAKRREADQTPAGKAREFRKLICKLSGEYTEWRPADPSEPGRKIPNLRVTDVQFWDNGAGETYIVDLTGNEKGTTRTRLRGFTDDIATKLNLPHGCGVEVLPARDESGEMMGAGFAAVDVSRVNVLKVDIPYPSLQPRTIMNPLPLGRTRSNKEIGPMLRESSAYLWGQKGSGKTVTVSDVIAGAMQCTDCLVWVIDLNRGNAARPFLRAWADGKVNRPCIDWVATTVEEVALMAQVGLQIALDRKSYYADLKFELDTNLMPVGNGGPGQPPPEILIVIDEGAEVLGIGGGNQMTDESRAARESLNKIMDLARDAAVNIVFSGLRATSDVADTSFMRGTSVRIGMRVTDDAELAHGFGDWKLSAKQIPYRGSGYIRCGYDDGDGNGDDIQVFKAYKLTPKRMAEIGEQCTPWRPYMDEQSLRTAGTIHANRWRRTAHLLWENPRPEVLNYGVRPGRDDAATIDGDIVQQSGTAVATVDRPASVSVLDDNLASGLATPTGTSFDDMMRHADKISEAQRRREQASNGGGAESPQPPQSYQPPAGGPGAGDDKPVTDQDFNARFQDLVQNATVLPADPEREWSRSGKITPEEEIAAAPADSRKILERLVRAKGPIQAGEMHAMLIVGGDWGPPVPISKQAMFRLLKEPGSKEPAAWLAPRETGDPYNHRANQSG